MLGPSTGTLRCFEIDEDCRYAAYPVSMMVSGDSRLVEDRWYAANKAAAEQVDGIARRPQDCARFTLPLLPHLERGRYS